MHSQIKFSSAVEDHLINELAKLKTQRIRNLCKSIESIDSRYHFSEDSDDSYVWCDAYSKSQPWLIGGTKIKRIAYCRILACLVLYFDMSGLDEYIMKAALCSGQ